MNGTAAARPRLRIDADQHLFEPRTLWADHLPARERDHALAILDDEHGNAWLTWRGERIVLAHVTVPGHTAAVGHELQRALAQEPPAVRYDDALPRRYWDPAARLAALDDLGVDAAVLFPNYGLTWERVLRDDLPALLANLTAWNRHAAEVASIAPGRLYPVAHVTLRDLEWLDAELGTLRSSGVRLAMVAPALVDRRPLSHPDLDRAWSAFVHHEVTPVFHVANFERPFGDAWYADDPEPTNPELSAVFLWVPPALALADLVLHGVLERHPELRLGVMELSAVWVPMFLTFLDGGHDFIGRLHGRTTATLSLRPSEYVRRQVRVAAFSYERPDHLARRAGELFMGCSDWPHSEGTATPAQDYDAIGSSEALCGDNVAWLLHA